MSLPLFAIVDIETTGAYAGAHSITEIAIIRHDGFRQLDSWHTLINPCRSISPYVSRLTGITDRMLADAPKFHEVASKIWEMTEDAVFVAHSVNFDYTFIREEFKSLGAAFRRKKLCTVRLSRKVFPGHTSYSLGSICNSLDITINDRHRAMGDASATVKLLERCISREREAVLKMLGGERSSRESILPPHLPADVFRSLPETTGVYYFHDDKGKVIYVGKAVNIRKRVYSHLTGPAGAKLDFITSIANITYQECGSELIALLLESHEIKRLYPRFNQAQKNDRGNYVLCSYTDGRGVLQLRIAKNHRSIEPVIIFRSFDQARETMFELMAAHRLCPRFCGMQAVTGACFDHAEGKCDGVCEGFETTDVYNEKVMRAIASLKLSTKVIIGQGRSPGEQSVVLIDNGVYKGFGFCPDTADLTSTEQAYKVINPYKHTSDAERILRSAIAGMGSVLSREAL